MRNNWVVGTNAPLKHSHDSSVFQLLYGQRNRETGVVSANGRSSWGAVDRKLTLYHMFEEPLKVPVGYFVVGLRQESAMELEKFGLVPPSFWVLTEIPERYGVNSGGANSSTLTGKDWLLMLATGIPAKDFLFFQHKRLIALGYELLHDEYGSSELLLNFAQSSLFYNLPNWDAVSLEMQYSVNAMKRIRGEHVYLSLDHHSNPSLLKTLIRDKIWDEMGLWCDWFPQTFNPMLTSEPFLQRADVKQYLDLNSLSQWD